MFILTWDLYKYATDDDKAKIGITTSLQHETLIRICQDGNKSKIQLHINEESWGEFDDLETFEDFEQGYILMMELKRLDGEVFEDIAEAESEVRKIIDYRKTVDKTMRGE